jgi:hypothetical protein
MVRLDHVDLPSLFTIGPIEIIENDHTRLQKDKIASVTNVKAEIEQFERSFPGMLARRGLHATINDEGPEAAAVLPALCSRPDAVRTVDQLQARL